MSTTRGILIFSFISFNAFAASIVGAETLTMSHPRSSNPWICSIVAFASVVSVVVIDWTVIGASPPICNFPTLTFLDFFLCSIFILVFYFQSVRFAHNILARRHSAVEEALLIAPPPCQFYLMQSVLLS